MKIMSKKILKTLRKNLVILRLPENEELELLMESITIYRKLNVPPVMSIMILNIDQPTVHFL